MKERNTFSRKRLSVAILVAIGTPALMQLAHAGAGWGDSADVLNVGIKTPTYYANSPSGLLPAADCFDTTPPSTGAFDTSKPVYTLGAGSGANCDTGTALRKFVDAVPSLAIATPDTATYPGSDYYIIALVEYTQRMHSDLAKETKLRGYVQLDAAGNQIGGKPSYLGPVIQATQGRPTRVKFINQLPAKGLAGSDLFIPTDETLTGAGLGPDGGTKYQQNRGELHLHGGDNPWISDGTPQQWVLPAADETALKLAGKPEMARGAGAKNVPDMPDPGPGAMTYYWPNGGSARMMFYHDHSLGATRLNVYAGEAAGYLIRDPAESTLMSTIGIAPADEKVLVIQDRTFVPTNIAMQDAKWDTAIWGQPGDLWFPHVYETNQDPNSFDGTNPVGRWDWGNWFWPVFPSTFGLPTGEVSGPVLDPTGLPTGAVASQVSTTPEAFMDTPIVNGMAYPKMTVEPKAYRFRILNASNDRFFNLGLYLAADKNTTDAVDPTNPAKLPTLCDGTTAVLLGDCTEVKMVHFDASYPSAYYPTLPATTPTVDGHFSLPSTTGPNGTGWGTPNATLFPMGVPDPATAGPNILQIGNEAGLLASVNDIPSTVINYEYNKRSVTVLNVQERGLFLGAAERADVVIDFSQYAGKTLILYNDSPAPVPASDPRIDYYTGNGDQTGQGGAPNTLPGYGPNTRTVMQIHVAGNPTGTVSTSAAVQSITVAPGSSGYDATTPPTVFVNGTVDPTLIAVVDTTGMVTSITGVPLATFKTAPTITFDAPILAGGIQATATATLAPALPVDKTSIGTALSSAYATSQAKPVVPEPDFAPAIAGMPTARTNARIYTGSVYLNKYQGMSFTTPEAMNYFPAPVCNTVAACNTAIAAQKAKPNNGLVSAVAGAPVSAYVESKAIQELFDPTYGRMNATLGVELPFTSALTQTTIPLGYVDPATEKVADGETQFWKITHNGVDTHPVHFHLVNVQVINRVGWDGTIKPPLGDEFGWKETVKMHPLEDIVVAVRAKKPTLTGMTALPPGSTATASTNPGFGLPNSQRLMDPSQIAGSAIGFTQVDPTTGNPAVVTNQMANYGWEYVWHCHILGHEENDFMRPVAFNANEVGAAAPTGLAIAGNVLTWADAATTEYAYIVERAAKTNGVVGVFTDLTAAITPAQQAVGVAPLANATTFTDTTALVANTDYQYKVTAIGANGNGSATVDLATAPAAPALAAPVVTTTTAALTWTESSTNVTGFQVWQVGGAAPITTVPGNVKTYTVTGLTASTTYQFYVVAVNGSVTPALTTQSNTVSATTTAAAAIIAPTNVAIQRTSTTAATLSWIDASNNETSFQVQTSTNGGGVWTNVGGPVARTGAQITGTGTVTTNISLGATNAIANAVNALYRVNAINASATASSASVSLNDTVAPTAAVLATPTKAPLRVFGVTVGTTVTLSWTDTANNNATYTLQRSTNNGTSWTNVSTTIAGNAVTTTQSFLGLTATTNLYRLLAVNSVSPAGVVSNTVTIVTP